MSTFSIRSNSTVSRAYNNLSKVQSSLNSNIERLSSGLRINRASDDSAGSSIATRMVNQINGMKQANANAQQTNNLVQAAESGLSDISDILGRMRELAVQAASDNVNDEDRASIDFEFQSLRSEATRIAHATEYDDKNLLDGSYNGRFQIGADNDHNNQLNISIGDASEVGLGLRESRALETAASIGDTTITLDDASGLDDSGTIWIDGDHIDYSAKSGDVLTVTALAKDYADGAGVVTSTHDDVLTVDHARNAISALDHAIDEVSEERGELGSFQNRLSFTISNLSNHSQAIESARSSIADVDFAAEATELAKNQILAQSGTAMLAQASAVSQNVLGLLM
jgi:flagellin